jgi:hypothetical protein
MKSLFALLLTLNSCGLGNKNSDLKQTTLSYEKSEKPQTDLSLKKDTMDKDFLSFWNKFTEVVKSKNRKAFKTISLDSLECEQKNVNVNTFVKSYFSKVFDSTLLLKISDSSKLDFINAIVEPTYFSLFILQQLKKGNYVIKEVNVTKSGNNDGDPLIIILKFIITNEGYKFYGYDRVG